MATITVRDLDEATRSRLRIRAARNGRSMEAEVRDILNTAVAAEPSEQFGWGTRIHAMFAEIGGADDMIALIPPRHGIEAGAHVDDDSETGSLPR